MDTVGRCDWGTEGAATPGGAACAEATGFATGAGVVGTAAVIRGMAGRAGAAGVPGGPPGGLPELGSDGSDIGVVYWATAGRSVLWCPARRVLRFAWMDFWMSASVMPDDSVMVVDVF